MHRSTSKGFTTAPLVRRLLAAPHMYKHAQSLGEQCLLFPRRGIGRPLCPLLALGGGETAWPAGRPASHCCSGEGGPPALPGNEDDTPAATGHPVVMRAAAPHALSRVISDQTP